MPSPESLQLRDPCTDRSKTPTEPILHTLQNLTTNSTPTHRAISRDQRRVLQVITHALDAGAEDVNRKRAEGEIRHQGIEFQTRVPAQQTAEGREHEREQHLASPDFVGPCAA